MFEADCGHVIKIEKLGCGQSAVASDDPQACIDKNGNVKAESLDASRYLLNLLVVMNTGILWIGPEGRYGIVLNC